MAVGRGFRRPDGEPTSDGALTLNRPRRSAPLAQASSATALLIVATVSALFGLFFAIPAVVLGLLAVLAERRSDPRAATLARWGWIAYVAGGVLMLLGGIALMVLAGYAASGNG